MPYPTQEEVYNMFKNLQEPPDGIDRFFTHFSPDVKYIVPGHGRFTGTFARKEDYYNATWAKFRQIIQPPGLKFLITDGLGGVIVNDKGQAVVLLETRDTVTKSGVPYEQFYSWVCQFNEEKLVVECRAYLDIGYLEEILGTEMTKQGID